MSKKNSSTSSHTRGTPCPECAGNMKFDSKVRRYVCHRCGLALTRHELDKMREQHRDRVREEKEDQYREKKERKEYLNWWLSKEK